MRKLWKKALAGLLVAGMMLTPAAGRGIETAYAEDVLLIAANPNASGSTEYNLADGSIVPTDGSAGHEDIVVGDFAIKVNDGGSFRFNDAQHGIELARGASIEFKVDGPCTVEVGDCQHSNQSELTLSSADGTWTKTVESKKGCWHNGSAVVFDYDGPATTLVITFEKAYVPAVVVTPVDKAAVIPFASEAVADGGIIASTENVTFTARQALSVSNKDAAVEVDGEEYTYTLKTSSVNNGKVGSSTARVFGEIAATAEADVQLVVYMGSGKAGYVFASDTQLIPTADEPAVFEAADAVVTLKEGSNAYKFTTEAGKYYYLLGQGTNLEVYGFEELEKTAAIGVAENFTFMYDENVVDGKVATGVYKFADSELTLGGQTVDGVITQYTVKSGKAITVNGKSYEAYTSGKRHVDSNNILTLPGEPDGCLTVFKPAAEGMFTVYYNSTSFLRVHDFNNDGTKNGAVDSEVGPTEYSFKVLPGHTYVMSTTGKTNNMFYAGYSYVVDEKISVPVTVTNVNANVTDALKLTLVDAQLGGDPVTIKTAGDTLKLLKGHTYKVSTNDGGVKALIGEADTFVATEEGVTITLNNVPDLTLAGRIVGTEASAVTKLVFTNAVNGAAYEATLAGDAYLVRLKPGTYNTSVETTNGGVTFDHVSVEEGRINTNDVYVELPDPAVKNYSYEDIANFEKTGDFAIETGKTHCVGKAGATVTIPVDSKSKVFFNAYYKADFTINGEQMIVDSGSTSQIDTFELITDSDVTVTFNATSYIPSISVVQVTEFKNELNVPGDYATMNEALDAISVMADRPEGEAGRVTINLTADLFEQVVVNTPYVTLKGNGHTISWYYGVGTLYYSVDPATGLYNKRLAMDKFASAEGNGNLWGGVFIVRGDNFIAEDTTFLNTYNYELTEAEKADIAGSTLSVDRLAEGADVTTHAYKERSNAFYIEADNIEVYNCKILSSQDTLGRNGSANNGYHAYFKDCVIGGNTDYICGEFSAIFDNCELQWKTYATDANNNAKVGYIVAPKTSPYVFRNCTITTDGYAGDAVVLGKFGRTWGANSNASFINVETNGLIDAEGWGEMASGEKASAIFNEYNVTSNGEAYASTGATNNTLEAVANYIDTDTVSAIDTVLASWTPVHYAVELTEEEPGEDPATEVTPDEKEVIAKTTDGREVYTGESIYVVKKGDCLWHIAKSLFGNGAKYNALFERNSDIIKKAELIYRGQELIVPMAGDVKVEEPKTEEPKTEEPKVEEPKTEEPKTEEPKTEEPKTEDTKVEDVVVDLSAGLTAGVDYNGISVLDNMAVKDGHTFDDGTEYAVSVQGSVNPSPKNGDVPTEGAAVKVTPKADGTFKVAFKLGGGKSYHLVDADKNVIDTYANESGDSVYLTKEYKLEAGKTYYFYGNGTKLPIYYLGLDY